MINEFGVKNFFGFKDWAVISCRLDKKVPEEISNGLLVTPILGIKGNNASGKTNILKILRFMRDFVLGDALKEAPVKNQISENDELIDITSFFGSKDSSDFFIDFEYEGTNYQYEFSLTKKEIISEILYVKFNKNNVKVFERNFNKFSYIQKKYKALEKIKLKKNVSIIAHIMNFDFSFDKSDFVSMNEFFKLALINVSNTGIHQDYSNNIDFISLISQHINERGEMKDFVMDMIKKSDLGISDIKIEANKNSQGEEIFTPYFIHRYNGQEHALPFYLESNGTRKLFSLLSQFWFLMNTGSFLAIDEFDIHLHPLLLPSLIDLFTKDCNVRHAQFIFTSHNTEIMDVLGKYRTVLVEKKDNESICYRIDEIPGIRGDRSLADKYLKGQLGGVPELG